MRNKPMHLSTRGLIAAAIASSASSYALAEQAGRVSFVTGEVKATAADGTVRALTRGDIINTGDKISTGGGRLQLRFTDGGFVSLQPNTVFGVDQYLYANKPPEETSLFFSLLQGGMRTITGAIGKVNKQSYKVRTPVATIGIRGTEYRARVDEKRLVVSVGSGFVNVANENGQITGGAGQNIQALQGGAPGYTTDEPDINATGPEGDQQQYAADDSENERQQRQAEQLRVDGNNAELANLLNPDGTPHPVPTYVDIPNGLPNGSNYSFTTTGANGPVTISGLTATFDPVTGAITSLVQTSPQEVAPPSGQLTAAETIPVITGPTFRPGTLKFVNNARFGNIGFGEITDGTAEVNDFTDVLPSSVGANEFYTYMMAVPTTGYMGGKASYSLQGGTLARINRSSDSGTLDHFNLDLNLLTGRADVDMLVKMTNSNIGNISVTGNGISLGRGVSTFSLGSGLTTTATGSFCASNSCSTAISGMFVGSGGSQVAASYTISSYMNNGTVITGYAALGKDKSVAQQNGYFSILMPNGDDYSYASIIRDANGRLLSFAGDDCGDGCDTYFDSGKLQFSNIGHSGDIYWGEYTNGQGTFFYSSSGPASPAILNAGEFQAYIVGPQVTPTFSGTAHYSLQSGSMAPRLNGGTTTGKLDRFNLDINLGTALAAIDMQVTMAGEIFVANQTNLNLSLYGSQFGTSNITTTSNGSSCSGSCYTDITGFFSGNNGNQLGVSYYIRDSSNSNAISGVAALGQTGSITPDPVTTDPESGFSLLTVGYGEGGYSAYQAATLEAVFNTDNTIASLADTTACEVSCAQFNPGTLQTASVGHSTNLRWGEFSNGIAASNNISGLPSSLSSTQYVDYIIGKQYSSDALNGNATATYTLQPGSITRAYDASGAAMGASLDGLVLKLNLFSGLADLAINFSNVGALQEKVDVTGSRISLPLLGMGLDTQGDLVDSYPGLLQLQNGLTVTSSRQGEVGGFCYEVACSANLYGILAGNSSEMGVSYQVNGAGTIVGVAPLAQTGFTSATNTPLESGGGYVMVADSGNYVILSNADPYNEYIADANFDSETGDLQNVSQFNGESTSTLLDASNATLSDTGTYKTLNWGRRSGSGTDVTYDGQTFTLGNAAGGTTGSIHYVTGTVTDPSSWRSLNLGYQGGTATYTMIGNTNPTDIVGNVGTLNSASLKLYLGSLPSVEVGLDVSINGNNYIASGSSSMADLTNSPAAATFSVSNMTTTVNGAACTGSCASASAHGFFSGSQAQQAGMTYSIVDPTAATTVTGAAAFKANTLTPAGG